MTDERFEFWCRWLSTTLLSFISLGILLSIFDHRTVPFLPEIIHENVWGQPEMPPIVVTYHRWLYGVIGSVFVAWGLSLSAVVRWPFRAREPWAWGCVCASVTAWYTIDTAASLFHGVWPNALFNSAGAIFLAVPLIATRRIFFPPTKT